MILNKVNKKWKWEKVIDGGRKLGETKYKPTVM